VVSRKLTPQHHTAPQPRHELLQAAELIAREKSIEKEVVIEAIEEAIQQSALSKYGAGHDIRVFIHRTTGAMEITKHQKIVKDTPQDIHQISIDEATSLDDDCQIGEELIIPLPPIEFGRSEASNARSIVFARIKEAERKRQFEEFEGRVGQIVSGIVKRVEFGNVILDIGGRSEGIIRRDELILKEPFRPGDRVRAYFFKIDPDARGPMIQLSRTHPNFLAKLFEQEVPEVYDGVIEIRSVARDSGSRAKMAVYSSDSSLDPVGSCVGVRGSRINAVVNELRGEKIDVIHWSDDPATLVVNALSPAEVSRVLIDEDEKRIDVVVEENQLSLAIGRRGQNVRLASKLLGWSIEIISEGQESTRRSDRIQKLTDYFINALDVDETVSHVLISEGFESIEDIIETQLEEIAEIEGFDDDMAKELQERAIIGLNAQEEQYREEARKLGVSEDLVSLQDLPGEYLKKLYTHGIETRDDLADLAADELRDILGEDNFDEESANALIMKAREHWFKEEK
jgi:N utilization substance protein A